MTDLKILRDIIRQTMDRESISDVLMQIGYEISLGKFSIRDERTPSATVFNDGWIKDFGDGWHGDIVKLMHDKRGTPLRDAVLFACEIMKIPTNSITGYVPTKVVKVKKVLTIDPKRSAEITEDIKQWSKNPQTFKDEDFKAEALEIVPMWVWQESTQYARDLFRELVIFDGETLVIKIFDYDGNLISYKRRRDGDTKWKSAYGTHPNGQCMISITEKNFPVYIVEGHHDMLTSILLGLNVLMVPTVGYKSFTKHELNLLMGKDVYLVPDLKKDNTKGIDCMRNLGDQLEASNHVKIIYLDSFLKVNGISVPDSLDLSDAVSLWTDRDKGFKAHLQYFCDEGIHHEGGIF